MSDIIFEFPDSVSEGQPIIIETAELPEVLIEMPQHEDVEIVFEFPQEVAYSSLGLTVSTVDVVADVELDPYRVVANTGAGLVYADKNTQWENVIGLTLAGTVSGQMARVQSYGIIGQPTVWTFVPGLVYLGNNGTVTQTIPTTGALVVIGMVTSATHFLIRIEQPIIL